METSSLPTTHAFCANTSPHTDPNTDTDADANTGPNTGTDAKHSFNKGWEQWRCTKTDPCFRGCFFFGGPVLMLYILHLRKLSSSSRAQQKTEDKKMLKLAQSPCYLSKATSCPWVIKLNVRHCGIFNNKHHQPAMKPSKFRMDFVFI